MVFTIKYSKFSCKFSHHPILWVMFQSKHMETMKPWLLNLLTSKAMTQKSSLFRSSVCLIWLVELMCNCNQSGLKNIDFLYHIISYYIILYIYIIIYIYICNPPRDRPFSLISLAHDILSSKVSLTESTTLHMTQEGYELTWPSTIYILYIIVVVIIV